MFMYHSSLFLGQNKLSVFLSFLCIQSLQWSKCMVFLLFPFFSFLIFFSFRILRLPSDPQHSCGSQVKINLKYSNLNQRALAPASMWAPLPVSVFFGSWQVPWQIEIQRLVTRDFKTKAVLQTCLFTTLYFGFLFRGSSLKYSFFLPTLFAN